MASKWFWYNLFKKLLCKQKQGYSTHVTSIQLKLGMGLNICTQEKCATLGFINASNTSGCK